MDDFAIKLLSLVKEGEPGLEKTTREAICRCMILVHNGLDLEKSKMVPTPNGGVVFEHKDGRAQMHVWEDGSAERVEWEAGTVVWRRLTADKLCGDKDSP